MEAEILAFFYTASCVNGFKVGSPSYFHKCDLRKSQKSFYLRIAGQFDAQTLRVHSTHEYFETCEYELTDSHHVLTRNVENFKNFTIFFSKAASFSRFSLLYFIELISFNFLCSFIVRTDITFTSTKPLVSIFR